MNLYRGVIESGSRPCLVHISTAYVAGVAKGVVPEDTLDHRVDWRTEGELALQARGDVEATVAAARRCSTTSWTRRRRNTRAPAQHGRRGRRAAAQGLGVEAPDALRAVARTLARVARRLHVHEGDGRTGGRGARRPRGAAAVDRSAIDHRERACSIPRPGGSTASRWPTRSSARTAWARSRSSPASRRGSSDLIPVDMVVNAILAVAGTPPEPRRPAYYHVSSGSRNPLQYHELYRYVRAVLRGASACRSAGAASTRCPSGRSPGSLSVERMIDRAEQLTDVAEKVVTHLPKSKRMRDLVSRVDRDKARVDFVKRYSDLYGAYTEAEVIYTDDRMLALSESLTPEDRERFPFDAAIIDWRYYLQDVHSPGRDAEPPRAVEARPREADRQDPRTRATGRRALRHGGHDHHVERRRVLRVDADGRPPARRVAARARERVREDPVVPADRPARPRRLPPHVLPPVRGRVRRGRGAADRPPRRRVHAPEGELRRRSAGSASTAPPVTGRSSSPRPPSSSSGRWRRCSTS